MAGVVCTDLDDFSYILVLGHVDVIVVQRK